MTQQHDDLSYIFVPNARFDTTVQVQLETNLVLKPLQAEGPKGRRKAVINIVRYRDSGFHPAQAMR